MTHATCPTCGNSYIKNEPWKKTCLACWKKKKQAEPPSLGANDELLNLRAEVFALRQMLAMNRMLARNPAIEPDMLARLIRLCHPDKHANNETSNTATAWLLAQRGQA